MASLSDKDAVYLIERVVRPPYISARGYDPLVFARAFNIHAKTETMMYCVPSGVATSSCVCWAVGHSG